METKSVRSESKLIDILQEDIRNSDKECIKIFTGHLPLIYHEDGPGTRKAELNINRWGEFSPYTFNLGCQLARYTLGHGKDARILIMADDLVEVPKDKKGNRKISKWMQRVAKKFYQKQDFLPEYEAIAKHYGVLEKIIEHQRSFGPSRFISEMSVIFQAMMTGRKAPNECSLAYNSMLNNPELFDANTDYLISFIPGQCKGNICAGVLDVRKDLDASHIFFPHIEMMGGILDTGTGFIKCGEEASIRDIYEAGFITYKKI